MRFINSGSVRPKPPNFDLNRLGLTDLTPSQLHEKVLLRGIFSREESSNLDLRLTFSINFSTLNSVITSVSAEIDRNLESLPLTSVNLW